MPVPPRGSLADNQAHVRGRFAERLLAQAPASVLDVGCGDGFLLRACRQAQIRVLGLDTTRGPSGGADLLASATELPLPEASFDWVSSRHILHHLLDPAAALAEAARVCRRGLVVAEPWFAPDLYGQANALWADHWLKACHRAQGRVHKNALDPQWIAQALDDLDLEVELETHLRLRQRPIEDFLVEAEACRDAAPDPGEYPRLLRAIRQRGLSYPGTVILVARTQSSTRRTR